MINGGHVMMYDRNAEAMRDFVREVLGVSGVDAGQGWWLAKLPPTEMGFHPTDGDNAGSWEFYFMCDDVEATVKEIEGRGGVCGPRADRGWGVVCEIEGPGGRKIALYEPRHPTAHGG